MKMISKAAKRTLFRNHPLSSTTYFEYFLFLATSNRFGQARSLGAYVPLMLLESFRLPLVAPFHTMCERSSCSVEF
jgi:hypothetical protein